MKKIRMIVAALALLAGPVAMACDSYGWRLVQQRMVGMDRLCVYEKQGVQMSILVQGFCPFSPC